MSAGQPGPSVTDDALERGDQPRPGPRRRSTIRQPTLTTSYTTQGRGVRFVDLTADGVAEREREDDAQLCEELANEVPLAILDKAGTIWTISTVESSDSTNTAVTRHQSIPIAALKKLSWKQQLSSLMVPRKKVGVAPSFASSLLAIVYFSWLNVLLVFLPVSWTLYITRFNDTVVFITTFLGYVTPLPSIQRHLPIATDWISIIPLANLLSFATDELTSRVGETLGGLINVTLGNIIETIVAIVALVKCELAVVQAALLGAILSDLLLVLGICFFAGGLKYSKQGFKIASAQLNSCLLTLCFIGIVIPTSFYFVLPSVGINRVVLTNDQIRQRVLEMSHGVAVILELIYASGLVYQLGSHSYLFDERHKFAESPRPTLRFPQNSSRSGNNSESKVFILHTPHMPDHLHNHMPQRRTNSDNSTNPGVYAIVVTEEPEPETVEDQVRRLGLDLNDRVLGRPEQGRDIPRSSMSDASQPFSPMSPMSPMTLWSPQTPLCGAPELQEMEGLVEEEENLTVVHAQEEGEEMPQMSIWVTGVLIFVVTALVSVSAQFLVDSINGLVASTALSDEWVGLVLLPMVGNASAHVTELFQGVTDTVEDKLDRSIAHAAGSSVQVALLVLPFVVLLGWFIGKPMTLLFDPFEAACLCYAVITVKVVIAAGHSDWLKGMILICLYIIMAVALWFYPGENPSAALFTCS
ncbi:hypothetical protein FRB96_001443 [Tulasnella sp. 330]|nr:hypothetical protein FRB96_001443 [Tulasnella sp. 330]